MKPRRARANSSVTNLGQNADRSRRDEIIASAAKRFAKIGYDATTMRDIAKETGILAGSIYYHFESKEELFIAVHHEAMRRIRERVELAIDTDADAKTQLRQASASYIQSLAEERQFAEVVLTEFPRRRSDHIYKKLVKDRYAFESVFRRIIAKLPLEPWVDRSVWRLALLSMLAWSMVWYREGRMSPREIADHLVDILELRTMAGDGSQPEVRSD